jgi:P pilus assembly chaperone PapD
VARRIRDLVLWGKTKLNELIRITGTSWSGGNGLSVFIQPRKLSAENGSIPTSWGWADAGSDDTSFLTEIQVLNPTASAITFSLAWVDAEDAEPDDTNIFLAKDVELPSKGVWQWQGKMSAEERYLFGNADAAGLVVWGCGESGASQ